MIADELQGFLDPDEVNAPIVGYFCQSNITTIKEKYFSEVLI